MNVFEKIKDLFFSNKESNKIKNYMNKKLYNLKYNYLFNFFDDKIEYNGKTIAGASIDIEFQIYYKNEPVYFIWDTKREKDPQCKSIQFRFCDYYSDLVDYELNHFFSVRFNQNSGYSIFANHKLLSPLEAMDYRIGITVSNFFIDTFTNSSKCISEPTEVSQEEFMKILLHNREVLITSRHNVLLIVGGLLNYETKLQMEKLSSEDFDIIKRLLNKFSKK